MTKETQEEKVNITQLHTRLKELVEVVAEHYTNLVNGRDPVEDEPNPSTEAVLENLREFQEAADGLQENISLLTQAYQQVAAVRV